MTKFNETTSHTPARTFPLHSLFNLPFGPRVYFEAAGDTTTGGGAAGGGGEGGAGGEGAGDPPAGTTTTTNEPSATPTEPKAGDQITDEVAKLLKDTMKHKKAAQTANERLALFGQVTPEQVQEMLAERRAAAEKKTADELAAAEARGEFDRVKQSMAEQHAAALEAERAKASEKDGALAAAQATISELTVGAAFGNSTYIREKTVVPAAKARVLYGAHFETEGVKVVGYDKPKGAEGRTPLVDAAGKPLPFEAAIAKLIESDPDKDHLLRASMASGANSKTTDSTKTEKENGSGDDAAKGLGRIRAALAAKKAAVGA